MLEFRRIFTVALPLALLVALVAPPDAHGAQPQTAEQLLNKAQVQFQNRDFVTARETLWQAYEKRSTLAKQQLKMLADLLGEVDAAIDKQVIARATYNKALKDLQAGKLAAAKTGLTESANCPYLKAAVRAEAKKHLANVDVKLAEQIAEQGPASDTIVLAEEAAIEVAAVDEATPAADAVEGAASPGSPAVEVVQTDEVDDAAVEAPTPVAEPQTLTDAAEGAVVVEETTIIAEEAPAAAAADETVVVVEETIAVAEEEPPVLTALQVRKIKAEEAIARGKSALEQNQSAKAVTYFQQALQLDPENAEALRQLNYARELTGRHGEAGTLGDLDRRLRIQHQMAVQQYDQAMKRSAELMSGASDDEAFDAAKQAVIIARNVVKTNKRLFTEAEYDQRVAEANETLDWIERKQDDLHRQRAVATAAQIDQAQRERAKETAREKQQKISDLAQRVEELRRERKFEDALQVMHQISELDPNSTWVSENMQILRQFIMLQGETKARALADHETLKTGVNLRYAEIPWYDKIRYPKDWEALTAERRQYAAGAVTESPENRRVREMLNQRIPQLNFAGVPLSDVVQFLREVTGANIYVNWRALEAAGVDRSTPVTINLSNISAQKALSTILDDVGGGTIELSYVVSDSVVQISTREDLNRKTETRVYDIRDLIVRIPDFAGPRVDLESITGQGGGDGGGGGGDGGGLFGDDSDDDEEDDEEMSRAQKIAEVRSMITETIDPLSWRPEGEIGSINELNGNLIVTQTAENHRRVGDLIAKLREARTIQISVEARFLTVNTGFLNQIGVDLDFYFNLGSQVGNNSVGTTSPYNNYLLSQIGPAVTTNVPSIGPSAWTTAGHNASGTGSNFSPIGAVSNWTWANVLGANGTTSVVTGIGGEITSPTMAIAGTFLDDIQVDFLIHATQAHKASRLLTAPRITMLNGQRAYVTVSTEQAYISDADATVAEAVAIFEPEIDFVPTGTVLDVEATVSHDRRYVFMTIRPQVVELVNLATTTISAGIFGSIDIGLPEIVIQDLQTSCSVPDGGTLLLGGQRLAHEIEREMGVPVISKLPILNRAFTNRGKVRDEQTLLIMVKPKILIQDALERDPHHYVATEPFGPGFGRFDD